MGTEPENHWKILDLQPGSSVEQISERWQTLSQIWDPSKHVPGTKPHQLAAQKQALINKAYNALREAFQQPCQATAITAQPPSWWQPASTGSIKQPVQQSERLWKESKPDSIQRPITSTESASNQWFADPKVKSADYTTPVVQPAKEIRKKETPKTLNELTAQYYENIEPKPVLKPEPTTQENQINLNLNLNFTTAGTSASYRPRKRRSTRRYNSTSSRSYSSSSNTRYSSSESKPTTSKELTPKEPR